jgi:chromosome segregation protein
LLKLKRVEIQGFKSFCDRTEMRFHGSGIAAVVGPNGCGKSNLSDAISWVLGEQSAKSLRGARMEDVIFAGTRERKPLGMASVTMTLVDPDHHSNRVDAAEAPTAPEGEASPANSKAANGHANGHAEKKSHEITITRRLFRSGESEYLIDGRAARLRDIQDLFMGTGLGPESYAIIEQGRIGQILSSKPQDRRSVIEEAAGITKFKTRRRLAEAKLEGAKQNLTRVFDILEEVGRQVNSLKRQAAKARRYEELKSEMTGQLRRALSGRYRLLEREAAKTALDLNLAGADVQRMAAELAGREAEQSAIQETCYRTEGELTQARQMLADLQLEAERTRGRLEKQAGQIGGIDQRLSQGESETQTIEARLEEFAGEIRLAAERLAGLETQAVEARERLSTKNAERETLQAGLRERERGIESSRQQVLRFLGEASSLRNQLAQTEEYLAGILRDHTRSQKEEQYAMGDLERLEYTKAEVSEKMAERQMELETIASQRHSVEEELGFRKTRAVEARKHLDELRGEVSRLKARRDSLEEIISHRAYTTESVKRLFTAIERGEAGPLAPAGVLADFVEVTDSRFERATEEFLHDELEYVVVNDWSQAESGVEFLRADLDGRATFLVHPEPGNPLSIGAIPEPAAGPETGIVARLSDVLRLTNGLANTPSELIPRLARCFLVDERPAAQRLALRYPDLYFLLPDGLCFHGYALSGGRKTGSGPLALKRELRELMTVVSEKQKHLDSTAALLAELERDIALLGEEVERLRVRQQSEERETLALDHEMRKMAEEFSRANSRLSTARLELQRLAKESERAGAQRERHLADIEVKDKLRAEHEQALEEVRQELSSLQAEVAHISEEHSVLRVELAGLEERKRSEGTVRARLEQQAGEMSRRRQQIALELERLGVERARLLADNIELDARAAELTGKIGDAQIAVTELVSEESRLRASLAAVDDSLKALRLELQTGQEKRAQIELELVRRQAELKFLDETSRKELNAPIDELAGAEEILPDEAALSEAEQRCQELKQRIEALGAVNPQALEEFEEAQQRYDFLNTQRQDLLDSIRDTEKAIQDIDVESRRRFSEAYEAINANFREMFRTLFAGGIGEMRLTDEANAGDSGIDIVASPPGKKLQNVLLLSGGEKALTAVALLMAIFKYQPSPFCILDEVDAPLDEPNIQRLTRLLAEMASQTQFIVITHAKRTMEAAQSMYGVTMQEPGVSKLVSVKFQPIPFDETRTLQMARA